MCGSFVSIRPGSELVGNSDVVFFVDATYSHPVGGGGYIGWKCDTLIDDQFPCCHVFAKLSLVIIGWSLSKYHLSVAVANGVGGDKG